MLRNLFLVNKNKYLYYLNKMTLRECNYNKAIDGCNIVFSVSIFNDKIFCN